jgi:hypothetical protein
MLMYVNGDILFASSAQLVETLRCVLQAPAFSSGFLLTGRRRNLPPQDRTRFSTTDPGALPHRELGVDQVRGSLPDPWIPWALDYFVWSRGLFRFPADSSSAVHSHARAQHTSVGDTRVKHTDVHPRAHAIPHSNHSSSPSTSSAHSDTLSTSNAQPISPSHSSSDAQPLSPSPSNPDTLSNLTLTRLLWERDELLSARHQYAAALDRLVTGVAVSVEVLPMVLGARAWDNWLLHQVHRSYDYFAGGSQPHSHTLSPPTVDASLSVFALHQHHPSRHGLHSATDAHSLHNQRLANGKWFLGSTDRTYWEVIDLDNSLPHTYTTHVHTGGVAGVASSASTVCTHNRIALHYRGPWQV